MIPSDRRPPSALLPSHVVPLKRAVSYPLALAAGPGTMPSAEVSSSTSHPKESRSGRDELAHYKAQYEQLESELADFQASSRELEAELEKDIEASEKRERKLKERLDKLTYEVDEWKVCQSIGFLPGPAGGFELTTPARRRPSTSSPSPRAAPPRMPYRRRSLRYETPPALCS